VKLGGIVINARFVKCQMRRWMAERLISGQVYGGGGMQQPSVLWKEFEWSVSVLLFADLTV